MANIDYNKILNSSPKKRLFIGFEDLKKDFNNENSLKYKELYESQSLSFILENSRYIFSEPYYGYNFYKNIIEKMGNYGAFIEYENELSKINDYITEHTDMPDEQKNMYMELADDINKYKKEFYNSSLLLNYSLDNDYITYETYQKIIDTMYLHETQNYDIDGGIIKSLMEHTNDASIFYTLTPYISSIYENASIISSNIDNYLNKDNFISINDSWKSFVESVLYVNKLSNDDIYKEKISQIRNNNCRLLFESLANESLIPHIESIYTEVYNYNDIGYASPMSAVNNIFESDNFYDVSKKENEEHKKEINTLLNITYESINDLLCFEYVNSDNTDDYIKGYDLFSEDTTIEDALFIMNESDLGSPSKTMSKHISNYQEENRKIPNNPKPIKLSQSNSKISSFTNKVLDAEAKLYKKSAQKKQTIDELKGAVKAVTNVPNRTIKKIQNEIVKWDEMNEEKRKEYMIKPGFRKKWFRNLKLSLLYGGAAYAKLSLVPLVMTIRHFSKKKDIRVRRELAREIETEIKICDEKIADADRNDDKTEKYKLMRIKSQLEKEQLRVSTNSKYI